MDDTITTQLEEVKKYAGPWGRTVVEVLRTPFPWMSAHMSSGPDDCDVTPWVLHPCFHGSLDWHSSAHMQASGVVLLEHAREALGEETAAAIEQELTERLTTDNAAVEATYLRDHPGYERPYGWAWAAKLAVVTKYSTNPESDAWAEAALVVAEAAADNLVAWLPKLTYPVRTGQHDNTAFGLMMAREAYGDLGRDDVVAVIDEHARRLYLNDTAYPAHYEPSGNDFLSAALVEAELMRAVLGAEDYSRWLPAFLPNLGSTDDNLLEVPHVIDRTDGKLVHLFGLALARAAGLRALADAVEDEGRAARMRNSADDQFEFAANEIIAGDFMSTHWLVTFALRALRVI